MYVIVLDILSNVSIYRNIGLSIYRAMYVVVLDIISNVSIHRNIEIRNFRCIVSNAFCPPSRGIPVFFSNNHSVHWYCMTRTEESIVIPGINCYVVSKLNNHGRCEIISTKSSPLGHVLTPSQEHWNEPNHIFCC